MGMMDLMMNAMTGSLSPEDKQDTMLKMMPEMIKQIKKEDIMELMGRFINKTTFITHRSKFGFTETIQRIKSNGEEQGWYNPIIIRSIIPFSSSIYSVIPLLQPG